MARRSIILLLWLLAGFVISIGVAWNFPSLGNSWGGEIRLTDEHRKMWRSFPIGAVASEPEHIYVSQGIDGESLSMNFLPAGSNRFVHLQRNRLGFPWRSVEGWQWNGGAKVHGSRGMFTARRGQIPWHPLWMGCVLNAIAFAIALFAVFRGPLIMRALSREYTHRCGACGYPVGSSERCTECGVALPWFAHDNAHRTFSHFLWHCHPRSAALAFVMFGAMMTIATSLIAAMVHPHLKLGKPIRDQPSDIQWLSRQAAHTEPMMTDETAAQRSPGFETLAVGSANTGIGTRIYRYRAGWPFHALEGVDWCGMSHLPQRGAFLFASRDTLFWRRQGQPGAIPLRPLWPGFVVNTLLFSGLIAIALSWCLRRKSLASAQSKTDSPPTLAVSRRT